MPTIEKILKRNGQLVDFDPQKIVVVVEKAFKAVLGEPMSAEAISVKDQVVRYMLTGKSGATPSVEMVQDLVERALMERGFFDVAKSYIIYRYEHSQLREEKKQELQAKIEEHRLMITKRDGTTEPFSKEKLKHRLLYATTGYEEVINVDAVVLQVEQEMYEGIASSDIEEVLVMVVRSFIERDPAYSHVASRLLLNSMYGQAFGYKPDPNDIPTHYRNTFVEHIKRSVTAGTLDPEMLTFDLEALSHMLRIERDQEFRYLGLQTLYTNYVMKDPVTKVIAEAPQMFWMRVAMGTALNEKRGEERMKWTRAFYDIMSDFYYTPSSPTLYHAGWMRPQLSSCFLNMVPDDLDAIFKSYRDNAQLLKYAGGTGSDWTPVRATGALIQTTGVESQGVIPFLKIMNDVTVSINRSGRRRGASAVYLETWHYDIEDFITLRKPTGDERRRTHDLNTVNWVPDLFMKRVEADLDWTLFSPHETRDLHDLYGKKFDERYAQYEEMALEGKMQVWKRVRAKDLWRKMITMLFETGHPWINFKDPCNIRQPQDHYGVVHNSNLCTEITLVTTPNETAVCNLGSLNFAKFVVAGTFDNELVGKVVPIAMRMLDNVIDVNFYPTEDAKRSNMKHRPVGLGIRGVQDALYALDIRFDSDEAVVFADESMEVVAYHTLLASAELASERGTYETYKGSKWDRGLLPQDTIALLEVERGMSIDIPRVERLNWSRVREAIRQHGMRNSNTMAIAPTATTANIVGCYPSIEPIYKNLYVKSNMAGDFVVVNQFLVTDLKAYNLWNRDMLEKIKYHDGSVQQIDDIPMQLREKYKEIFDIGMRWLIKAAAYRGRWIDQSQSLNIFYRGTSGKDVSDIYFYAWKMGLKTTYYLRTTAATKVEQSTMSHEQYSKSEDARKAKQQDNLVSSRIDTADEKTFVAPSATSGTVPVLSTVVPREPVPITPRAIIETENVCVSCEG